MENKIVLSLGGGVQSTSMALMLDRKILEPMPDVAIFADTGAEPRAVYDNLEWLSREIKNFPVVYTRLFNKYGFANLDEDVKAQREHSHTPLGAGSIPVFTLNHDGSTGIARRQCTSNYKIAAIEGAARFCLYYKESKPNKRGIRYHGQRLDKYRRLIMLLGISQDEILRMKDNRHNAIENRYPLIDAGYTRLALKNWFEREYPDRTLTRSACYFCPYRDPREWVYIADNEPELFEQAIQIDENSRLSMLGDDGKISARYLHRRRIPLRQAVEVDRKQLADEALQYNFGDAFMNECEGHCGI